MGIKLAGRHHNKIGFKFESDKEREFLDDARNYFGDASTLFTKGLGYNTTRKNASGQFSYIRMGKFTIPIKDWGKIQEYASRYRSGERSEGVITLEV